MKNSFAFIKFYIPRVDALTLTSASVWILSRVETYVFFHLKLKTGLTEMFLNFYAKNIHLFTIYISIEDRTSKTRCNKNVHTINIHFRRSD